MLNLSFSNRPEHLLDRLVDALGAAGGDPFEAAQVIVPSSALRRRIELALADAHGICANVRFGYLAQWLWAQIGHVVRGVSQDSPFAPAVLAWRIYGALGDASFTGRHPRLSAWLARADGPMRLEIATRLAGLFDQYTTYRPHWLHHWSLGLPAGITGSRTDAQRADEAWQGELWQRLSREIGLGPAHPSAAFLQALRAEAAAGRRPAGLPAQVHVFGLPSLPPLYLETLRGLAAFVDVHCYAVNPCREYWFDLIAEKRLAKLRARRRADHAEVGHPLLSGWGGQTQAHVAALFDTDDQSMLEVVDERYVPAGDATLLGRLQDAILTLQPMAPCSAADVAGDRTLEVHVCHSLTRELEVLHDRLMGLFAGTGTLHPSQVAVLVPDLEAAAPLIDAVFGTVPGERAIPYTITGQPARRVNRVARALDDLLAVVSGRLVASEVFGLLEQAPVARRFGLDADALDAIRAWIHASGIRWGADAAHRAALGLPAWAQHSFDDGLQRLFLAYAMGDAGGLLGGRLPAGNPEGQAAGALGRFWRFVESLRRLQRDWRTPRPGADWHAALTDALDAFVAVGPDGVDEMRPVSAALAAFGDGIGRAALADPLPLDVVRQALAAALEESARGGVPGGAVTFGALSSLRGLPYRVVCVLGLDDGAFPGARPPAEFDLIAAAPEKGDRQRGRDDRTLFLDAVLSARERLHLSYSGRDLRDNAEKPPSVLVAELLDHLVPACAAEPADADALAAARRRLVVGHPLQPFSLRYFVDTEPDARLRSFDADYCSALKGRLDALANAMPERADVQTGAAGAPVVADADADTGADADDATADDDATALDPMPQLFRGPLPPPGPDWRDTDLSRLLAFFRNPSRVLLEDRLALRLGRTDDGLLDDEPFLLDLPARRRIAAQLLPAALDGAGVASLQALARAGAELPPGALGARLLDDELLRLHRFAATLRTIRQTPADPVLSARLGFDLDGEAWSLSGAIADLRDGRLQRWRYDDARATDYLDAWIHHLFACAARGPDAGHVTHWIARDGAFALRPCEAPHAHLHALIRLMRQGLTEPLHFFPRSAWAFVSNEGSLAKAMARWTHREHPGWGESQDPYHRLALRGVHDPLDHAFETAAMQVFGPVLAHLETVKP